MEITKNAVLTTGQLAAVPESIPAGITVIDPEGRMLH